MVQKKIRAGWGKKKWTFKVLTCLGKSSQTLNKKRKKAKFRKGGHWERKKTTMKPSPPQEGKNQLMECHGGAGDRANTTEGDEKLNDWKKAYTTLRKKRQGCSQNKKNPLTRTKKRRGRSLARHLIKPTPRPQLKGEPSTPPNQEQK